MDTISKNDSPNFISAAAAMMAEEIEMHYDLMGGTQSVRAKAERYLPQLPLESAGGWSDKLSKATIYNRYAKTVATGVGLVTKREPRIGEDGAAAFRTAFLSHWENITSDGMHGKTFIQKVLTNAFAGHVFIVVDYPQLDANIKDKVDEQRAGRRPFWSMYEANQAVNWRVGQVNNRTVLTQITFKETQLKAIGGFGEEAVTFYRTWALVPIRDKESGATSNQATWTLRSERQNDKGETVITLEGGGATKLTRLPVAIAYGEQTGFATSKPPLADLAYKNIEHYQDYADYRKGKTIAGIAFLKAKGLTNKSDAIGWDVLFELSGEGDINFVEAGGKALESQRLALHDTEAQMSELGLALLADRSSGDITATQAVIDHAERSSTLLTIADSLKDAVETAIEIHGEYLNYSKEQVCSIDLGYKPDELVLTAQSTDLLLTLHDKGLLSDETLLKILKGGGVLPDDLDPKAEIAARKLEANNLFDSLTPNDNAQIITDAQ